jgi:hypothetical protein
MTRFTVATLALIAFAQTAKAECTEPTGIRGFRPNMNAQMSYHRCLIHETRDRLEALEARVDQNEVDINRLGECGCEDESEVPELEFSLHPLTPSGTGFYPGQLEVLEFYVDNSGDEDMLLKTLDIHMISSDYRNTGWNESPVFRMVDSVGTVVAYGMVTTNGYQIDFGEEVWLWSGYDTTETFTVEVDATGASTSMDDYLEVHVTGATFEGEDGDAFTCTGTDCGLPVQGRPIYF